MSLKITLKLIILLFTVLFTALPFSVSANPATAGSAPRTTTVPAIQPETEINDHQAYFIVYAKDLFLAVEPQNHSNSRHLSSKHEKQIFVDVRSKKIFRLCHIPGSLNIPLHELKHKPFLKQKNLVLINNGGNYAGLQRVCHKLVESGFRQAAVLVGGLTAWRDVGGELVGDPFAIEKIDELAPAAYFADRLYDDWLVVRIVKNGQQVDDTIFPGAVTLNDSEGLIGLLGREIRTASPDLSTLFTLLVNDDGNYRELKKKIHRAGITNIFYLQGGVNAYATFLKNSRLTNTSLTSKSTSHKVKRCRSCP